VASGVTSSLSPQTCPQCGAVGTSKFCGECGHALTETPASSQDIRSLVREGAAEALGLDRRIIATARDLLRHPTRVVAAHLRSSATPYVHPLKLFFVLAGVYILVLASLKLFSFDAEFSQQTYQGSLAQLVYGGSSADDMRRVFAEHGLTQQDAETRFEERANAAIPLATVLALLPMTLILGLMYRDRPRRDHFMFLLVMSNAVWLVSLLAVPLMFVSQNVGVLAMYAGMYVYYAVTFFGIYGSQSRARTAGRFLVFVTADFVVRSLMSALLTIAIFASIPYP
jgi:hypothetical protein